MLFEDDRRRKSRLQAVGRLMAHDATKAPERRPTGRWLHVVVERVQEPLNRQRRGQPLDETPFARGEGREWWCVTGGQRRSSNR